MTYNKRLKGPYHYGMVKTTHIREKSVFAAVYYLIWYISLSVIQSNSVKVNLRGTNLKHFNQRSVKTVRLAFFLGRQHQLPGSFFCFVISQRNFPKIVPGTSVEQST